MRLSWKKTIVSISAVALTLFALLTACWLVIPERTVRFALGVALKFAKLEERQVETKFGNVHYYDGGQGETVVILHGIYSRKENWLMAADILASQYRLIVPDLPGFGANEPLGEGEYRLPEQQERLLAFLDEIGVDRFHVAGSSMGGLLAASLAQALPDRVASISFLGSPLGLSIKTPSELDHAMQKGRYPLVVDNKEAFWQRFEWLDPMPSAIALIGARGFMQKEVQSAELNRRIWREVMSADLPNLDALAGDIQQPALVVWCAQDRVFHASGATKLKRLLPKGHLHIMQGCGHAPILNGNNKTLFYFATALAYVRQGRWPPQHEAD